MLPKGLSIVKRLGPGILGLFLLFPAACGAPDSPPSRAVRDGRATGPDDASIVFVLFGDYGCSPCARFGREVRRLIEERGETIRFIYRHCPSNRNPTGRLAAAVAASITDETLFWRYHWLLVEQGPIRTDEHLWELVAATGLDREQVQTALDGGEPEEQVERDLALADALGIRGTPTSFVGSRRIDGYVTRSELREIIDAQDDRER